MNDDAIRRTAARLAQEAIAANSKTAGGRRANARMGALTVSDVKVTIAHDRLSVGCTFPTTETLRFSVTRSGERFSFGQLKAAPLSRAQMTAIADKAKFLNGEKNSDRVERFAELCRGAKSLADMAAS